MGIALVGVAAACLAVASPAFAASHHYCGPPNLVDAGFACWSGDEHTYNYNQARYAGSGALEFCERLASRDNSYSFSYNCRRYAGTVKGYAGDSGDIINPNRSTLLHDQVVNRGRGPHTLYGYSTW